MEFDNPFDENKTSRPGLWAAEAVASFFEDFAWGRGARSREW
jgi:hypothetical protein